MVGGECSGVESEGVTTQSLPQGGLVRSTWKEECKKRFWVVRDGLFETGLNPA